MVVAQVGWPRRFHRHHVPEEVQKEKKGQQRQEIIDENCDWVDAVIQTLRNTRD